MAATLGNMVTKPLGIPNLSSKCNRSKRLKFVWIVKYFIWTADDIPIASPIDHMPSVNNKTVFRDKKEAIEMFKEFLKEKVTIRFLVRISEACY